MQPNFDDNDDAGFEFFFLWLEKHFFLSVYFRLIKFIDKMLQSRGISDLLAAEKKAQELIEEARKRKFLFAWFFIDFF